MKITIINGPNLNLLGTRETDIYGSQNFESYLDSLKTLFADVDIDYFQSNIEGEIINFIQNSKNCKEEAFDEYVCEKGGKTPSSAGCFNGCVGF